MTGFISAAEALLRAHGLSFLALSLSFVVAHWTLIGFLALIFISALNRLLPGHPMLAGAARRAIDLLSFAPMKNGQSAAFSWLASKAGDNFAGAVFSMASKWLNVPLSPSVASRPPLEAVPAAPSSAGFVRLGLLPALAVALLFGATACGYMSKTFGPTIGSDEAACLSAGISDVKSALVANVTNVLLKGSINYEAELAGLAVNVGNDVFVCALHVAIADLEKQAAKNATTSAPSPQALVAFEPDPTTSAIARGYDALERFKARSSR